MRPPHDAALRCSQPTHPTALAETAALTANSDDEQRGRRRIRIRADRRQLIALVAHRGGARNHEEG